MRAAAGGGDMSKASIIATAVLGLVLTASAADARVPIRAGGNLALGFPIDEFRDNVDETGVGLDGYVAFGIPNSPLYFGGALGYLSQGSVKAAVPLIFPFVAEITTRNNVFSGHAFLRLQHTGADFEPYLDVLAGFNRFFTTTELRFGDVVSPSTDFDDWTVSYGLGGGLMFEVYERIGEGKTGYSISVEMGARYLIGGRADYVDIDSVELIGDAIFFDTTTSRTNMVTVRIGASVLF